MALPSSGPISMGDINVEAGLTRNTANTKLAGASSPTVDSLFGIYTTAGVNQTPPHAISEFYGISYTTTLYMNLCVGSFTDGSGFATVTAKSQDISDYNFGNLVNVDTSVTIDFTIFGQFNTVSDNITISSGTSTSTNTYGGFQFGGESIIDISIDGVTPSSFGTQAYTDGMAQVGLC